MKKKGEVEFCAQAEGECRALQGDLIPSGTGTGLLYDLVLAMLLVGIWVYQALLCPPPALVGVLLPRVCIC